MKKITNHIILDPSNEEVLSLIEDLKQGGISENNFIHQNNQVHLDVENTPLFTTLTETSTHHVTTQTYSLYYQNNLLATTENKINVTGETCLTRVYSDVSLPSTLSPAPVSIMKSNDYRRLYSDFNNAFWEKDKQEVIRLKFERSLVSQENMIAFNEYVAAVLNDCYNMLNNKTRKTSFAGYRNQFMNKEQGLIQKSAFLMEYMSWLTPENQDLGVTVGLQFLRTISNGYSFLPGQPCHSFFTKPEHKKAYIDNFISYARTAFESRDKSGEWRENEQRRFNSFIDFAISNDLDREMDDEQRKHFLETIHLIDTTYDLPHTTFMLFNPDNISDRTIFNKIMEDVKGTKNIPRCGLISKHNLENSTKAELDNLRKLLTHENKQLLNSWGYLKKPEINESNSIMPALNRYGLNALPLNINAKAQEENKTHSIDNNQELPRFSKI